MIDGMIDSFASTGTGYHVMFRYSCSCGEQHSTDASDVWTDITQMQRVKVELPNNVGSGYMDLTTQVVEAKCPKTSAINQVQLTKPFTGYYDLAHDSRRSTGSAISTGIAAVRNF